MLFSALFQHIFYIFFQEILFSIHREEKYLGDKILIRQEEYLLRQQKRK